MCILSAGQIVMVISLFIYMIFVLKSKYHKQQQSLSTHSLSMLHYTNDKRIQSILLLET